jgi:acyl dehydratase
MTGRVLTNWFGTEGLLSYGVRFVKQVWPGDALTATATVTSVADGVAELTVETVNQAGEPVVTGTAKARVD